MSFRDISWCLGWIEWIWHDMTFLGTQRTKWPPWARFFDANDFLTGPKSPLKPPSWACHEGFPLQFLLIWICGAFLNIVSQPVDVLICVYWGEKIDHFRSISLQTVLFGVFYWTNPGLGRQCVTGLWALGKVPWCPCRKRVLQNQWEVEHFPELDDEHLMKYIKDPLRFPVQWKYNHH